jgi:hypothetical protein
MELSKILAISGKPGLHKVLSQTKAGFIVESLADGKRYPVFAHERVSSLEEISIFTKGEDDLPLKEVFRKIYDKLGGQPGPDTGTNNEELKKFFLEAIPEYDPERVYVSDIKKALAWYNLLLAKEMLDFTEEKAEADETGEPASEEEKKDSETGEEQA